jgi:hypothetical protein
MLEEMLNILVINEMQIKKDMKISPHSNQNGSQEEHKQHMLVRMHGKSNKLVQLLCKAVWKFLKKLKINL